VCACAVRACRSTHAWSWHSRVQRAEVVRGDRAALLLCMGGHFELHLLLLLRQLQRPRRASPIRQQSRLVPTCVVCCVCRVPCVSCVVRVRVSVACVVRVMVVLCADGDDDALRWAIFHSVSSFSNAGISTTPNNMVAFQDYPFPLFVSSLLILAGTHTTRTTRTTRTTHAHDTHPHASRCRLHGLPAADAFHRMVPLSPQQTHVRPPIVVCVCVFVSSRSSLSHLVTTGPCSSTCSTTRVAASPTCSPLPRPGTLYRVCGGACAAFGG
jgi:hypothetical protein